MKILIIEDEAEMAGLVARAVGDAGFAVDCVGSLEEAAAAMALARYSAILLDRRLPDGEGLTLIDALRRAQPRASILIISAYDAVPEKVLGLDRGADDYLAKPFEMAELLARLRAALRRPGGETPPPIRCGRLSFDLNSREVWADGVQLILKRRELALIESLIRRAGRVIQRASLIDEVYGFDDEISSNTLDSHISRLRAKLAEANAGVAIHPVRGVGYILDHDM
ncbi:response regulator [Sphingomonas sp. GlSt437]